MRCLPKNSLFHRRLRQLVLDALKRVQNSLLGWVRFQAAFRNARAICIDDTSHKPHIARSLTKGKPRRISIDDNGAHKLSSKSQEFRLTAVKPLDTVAL